MRSSLFTTKSQIRHFSSESSDILEKSTYKGGNEDVTNIKHKNEQAQTHISKHLLNYSLLSTKHCEN